MTNIFELCLKDHGPRFRFPNVYIPFFHGPLETNENVSKLCLQSFEQENIFWCINKKACPTFLRTK